MFTVGWGRPRAKASAKPSHSEELSQRGEPQRNEESRSCKSGLVSSRTGCEECRILPAQCRQTAVSLRTTHWPLNLTLRGVSPHPCCSRAAKSSVGGSKAMRISLPTRRLHSDFSLPYLSFKRILTIITRGTPILIQNYS